MLDVWWSLISVGYQSMYTLQQHKKVLRTNHGRRRSWGGGGDLWRFIRLFYGFREIVRWIIENRFWSTKINQLILKKQVVPHNYKVTTATFPCPCPNVIIHVMPNKVSFSNINHSNYLSKLWGLNIESFHLVSDHFSAWILHKYSNILKQQH